MKQIWQDTTFTVSALTQPISVTVDGKEIYRGVLSSYPGEDNCRTLLNKICEPYLEMDYPTISGVTTHSKAYRVFTVKDWSGNTLGTQDFIYDWSYEAFRNVMSKPVNGKLDPRMRLPYTMWRSEAGDVEVDITTDPWFDPDVCPSDCSWDMCDECPNDYCASDFIPPEPLNEIFISELQVPGNKQYSYGNTAFTITYVPSITSAVTCSVSSNYFSVTGSGYNNIFRMIDTNSPAPTGDTGVITLTRNFEDYGTINYKVTSLYKTDRLGWEAGVANEQMVFNVTRTPGGDISRVVCREVQGSGGSGLTLVDTVSTLGYNLADITLRTLISDGVYASFNPQVISSSNDNGVCTVTKSAKSNAIRINTNTTYDDEILYTLTLGSGYNSIMVRNKLIYNAGLTDIYIDNTVQWFNSLPDLNDWDDVYRRGKYYVGYNGDYITVHCTNGNVIWTPNSEY